MLENTKVLMIIAHFEFRDEEYEITREVLEKNGAKVTVASTSLHPANGRFGMKVKPDVIIRDISMRDFDAIVLIGGRGAKNYFTDHNLLELLRAAFNQRILLAAICIAPSILAYAGLLTNKKATASLSQKEMIAGSGAYFSDRAVEQDGEIITASGPADSEDFGKAIVKALEWRKERKGYFV